MDSNPAANSVTEGAAINTLVGVTAFSTDSDSPTVTYSLSSDSSGGGFKIDAATGVVSVADPSKIDFESPVGHAYIITTQASDGTATSSQNFTIKVNDVTPSVPVDGDATADIVAEGAAVNTLVGITAVSTDINGPGVTWSLTGDSSGGGFKIDPTTGVISVADPSKIDFESSTAVHAYAVTATASDGAQTSSRIFSISVADVAPSAPVDGNTADNIVAEGAAVNTLVGVTAVSTDVNGPGVTWSLTGDTSGGGFKIDPTTGVISVADPSKIDFESSTAVHAYAVTATASDGWQTSSVVLSISVADVAPSTPVDGNTAANSVLEGAVNGTAVGITAVSTDIIGPGVTWSLIGDTSNGGFTINAATGVVTVANPTKIDYETAPGHAYTITAQASDGTLASAQTFTIYVQDAAPSVPVDGNTAPNVVAEGAASGTAVGITAISSDVNSTGVTWSLIGDTSNGGFTIDAVTGVVTVADPTKIDYETAVGHAYTVTAQASDGALQPAQVFTINVTDVALPVPTDINATGNSVAEAAANGTAVGITASAVDPNGPATTYSLIGDTSNGGFTINATSGVVTVANFAKINYESAVGHAYSITVQAQAGAQITSQVFNIDVTDVAPSAPTDIDGAANLIPTHAANGSSAHIHAASTDVNGGTVKFSIVSDTSLGGFFIDENSGIVTIADSSKINYNTAPGHAYTIRVAASDGTLSSTTDFVVDISPNTPPTAVNDTATMGENQTIDVDVLANDTDPDPGETKTLVSFGTPVITGPAGAVFGTPTFSIVANQMHIVPGTAFDTLGAGETGTMTVSYTMQDTAGAQSTATVTVTINGADDLPAAVADNLSMSEDAAATSFNVIANDTQDADHTAANTISLLAGMTATGPAGTGIDPTDVTASIVANQVQITLGADFQKLAAGETATIIVPYRLIGDAGETSDSTLTVTVNGANDTPTANADTGSMSEDAAATPFDVILNDVKDADHTAANTISLLAGMTATGPAGTNIDPTDVTASIVANQIQISLGADFQKLAAGETATITVPYSLTGDAGDSSNSTLTVTVTGANDTPTANLDTGSMGEDAAATPFDVILNDVQDADHTAANAISLLAGMTATGPGGTNIDPTDVTASIVSNQIQISLGADFQKLAAGETATINVPYRLTGDAGDTSDSTLTVTVHGANDTPTATANTGSMGEDDAPTPFDVIGNDIQDADHTAANAITVLAGTTASDPGGTTIDGLDVTATIVGNQIQITLGADFQQLAAGQSSTIVVPYRLTGDAGDTSDSTLTITVDGANDAPTLSATGSNPAYALAVDLFSAVNVSTVDVGQNIDQLVLTVTNVQGVFGEESLRIDGDDIDLFNGTSKLSTTVNGMTVSVTESGGTATVTISKSGGISADLMKDLVDNLSYTNHNVTAGETPRVVTIVSLHDTGGTGAVTGTPAGVTSTVIFNIAPETNDITTSGNEDTTITIALSGTDTDGTVASFKITSLPAGTLYSDIGLTTQIALNGTVTATGNAATVYFVPAANFNGNTSFQYTSIDDVGAQDQTPATVSISVTSVNDAPAGTDHTVNAALDTTLLEDSFYTFTTADFGFSDVNDSPANTLLAVKMTTVPLVGAGTLTNNGVTVNAGDSVTVAAITGGLLKYTPVANANGAGQASFTFQVQDNGGGADLDPSANTMTINVTPVNDAPAGTNHTVNAALDATLLEDSFYTFTTGDFGFSDTTDAGANSLLAVKITAVPLAGAGTLTNNGVTVNAGDSVTAAAILGGLLHYTPVANANGAGQASFTFQVQDDGGTANSGVDLDQSANTMTINVTPVNDAPAGTDKTINPALNSTLLEDGFYVFTTADFGFSDVIDGNTLLAVKMTTSSLIGRGVLTNNGVTVNDGDFVTAAAITGGLLKYTPVANSFGAAQGTFTFQVQDNGGTTNGGVDLDQSANTMTINVTSVNDAPAGTNHTVNAAVDTTLLEDGFYTFTTADFGFSDVNDSPANTLLAVKMTTVPLVGAGTLTNNGVTVNAGDSVTVAAITGGLLKFTPVANANGTPEASFTFQVQDNGGTANTGVDLDQSANTMTINVTSVNDAPAGTDKTINPALNATLLEDSFYTFTAGDFGFTDTTDGGSAAGANSLLAVKITTVPLAGAGTLTNNGVTVNAGDTVTAAAITGGLLRYTPVANANGSAQASFTFQVQDNGGTTNGGVDLDQSANTMTINVTPVNDAPTFTGVATISDTEDGGANSVLIASAISTGPANESAQTVDAFVITNNTNAAMFSVAPSIAANGTLTYTLAANYAGTAKLTYHAHDDGGTANGGVNVSVDHTIDIDASVVADTPTYTANFTPQPFTVPTTATSNEFQVTTTNANILDQGSAVAGLVDSLGKHTGFVVVWLEQPDINDAATARIVGQRYDINGNPVHQDGTTAGAQQFNISTTSGVAPANTNSVTAMPDGGFLVTWTAQDQNNAGGDDIQGRIVSATGALGTIFTFADPAKQLQTESNSVFSNGDFVVVSEKIVASGGSADGDIVFQRYTSSGTTVTAQGGQTTANSNTSNIQDNADVAALSDAAHRFVAVWQSDSTTDDDPSVTGVYMRIFNFSNGSAVTSDIRVNTTTTNTQSHPNVIGLANGNFAVTWTSFNQVSGSSSGDIYLRIFNDAGTQVVGETLVNTTTANVQDTPEITQLADGGFLVQWISVNQDSVGDPSGVYAQRFDLSGNKVGNEFMVPSNGSGNQAISNNFGHEGLSMLADGKAAFTWFNPDAVSAEPEGRVFAIPGLGQETSPIRLPAIATAVTDTVGTNLTNGGIETEQVVLQFTLGAGDTITLTDGTGPHTLTFNTAGAKNADVTGWNYATITVTPTGFTGSFSINAHIVVTDQATLSTGLSTDTHTEDHTIPIFIIPQPDPVFVADNAGPVDLHLSHISAGSTASITAEPDNGSLVLADGTAVHTGATLTSAELAGLTFVPKDVSGEASSNLAFTVSDGATSSAQNIPIHVVDGAAGGVTLTGTEDKDVLAGGPSHDILNGNGGTDFMTGGGGADTFVFNQAPQQNAPLTHVTDYSAAQGDVFDFSSLTSASHASSVGDAALVRAVEDASGNFATLQVNTSGGIDPYGMPSTAPAATTAGWVSVAQLDGVHAGDAVNVLVDSHSAVHLAQIHVDLLV